MEQGHEPGSLRSRVRNDRNKKARMVMCHAGFVFDGLMLIGSGLVVIDRAMNECADDGADDWRGPEQPELRDRPVADEDCDAGAACGVHRAVGDRDRDQVDEREGEADGDGREALRRAFRGGSEDDHEEEGCREDFGDEAGDHRVLVRRVLAEAV